MSIVTPYFRAEELVPEELAASESPQTAVPAIAKDGRLVGATDRAGLGIATSGRD
jgi:hypothetical protein